MVGLYSKFKGYYAKKRMKNIRYSTQFKELKRLQTPDSVLLFVLS
jgi:hypothetical protein